MASPNGAGHGPAKGAGRRGFGRLRRLPSGMYQAAYTGPDGQVHRATTTFPAKEYAEGWLGQELTAIKLDAWTPPSQRARPEPKPASPPTSGVTLQEYAGRWLNERAALDPGDPDVLRPSSVKDYRLLLHNHILPTLGKTPLVELEPEQIVTWHRKLAAKKTPRARAKAYSLLRTILNAAVADRTIPDLTTNPCQIKGAGRVPRAVEIQPATLAELDAIVADMPERLRLAVLLGAWCALRYGETFELRRKDLDLKNGLVRIRRGVVWVKNQTVMGEPKTKAGRRTVAIPPHLMPLVTDHLKRHVAPGAEALLFPAEGGGNLRPSGFQNAWHHARAAAGRGDLKYHHLRHTGAVLAAQSGATLAELMSRLGHSTPAMAMIYQHAAADRDKAIAAQLSAMAGHQRE